jgi:hypothetical protein
VLCHKNLMVYYHQIFTMTQHYKYQIDDLENTIPYEFGIYFDMLLEFIKKQEQNSHGK